MKKIIVLLLVLLPLFASAADDKWVLISPPEMVSEYAVFVNEKIVSKADGYKVWVRWFFYSQLAKEHYNTTAYVNQELYEITPDLEQLRILTFHSSDISGKPLDFSASPSDWVYPSPDSMHEAVIKEVKRILKK